MNYVTKETLILALGTKVFTLGILTVTSCAYAQKHDVP